MKKRAINPVITTVFLISISLILAVIIIAWAANTITQLSPKSTVRCDEIYFRAEIIKENSKYFLAANNLGNVNISGFQINTIETGTVENKENIQEYLSPGQSTKIKLTTDFSGYQEVQIIPTIETLTCPEEYGIETKIHQ